MIKNIYLFVCLIIFIFLIIIIIKINYYFNTIENFKYGYNCLTCASCANGGYLIDTTDEDSNIISSQNNGEFNYFKFVNRDNDDHKIYTFNVYTDLTCDILIIGGGGTGGSYRDDTASQAGGGAGGIVYIVNQVLPANTYKIKVGRGGKTVYEGGKPTPENGKDSMITDLSDNVIELTAILQGASDVIIPLIGYGGGHGAFTGYSTPTYTDARRTSNGGGDGGSGGGGTYSYGSGWGGYSIQGNTFWNGEEFVQGGHNGNNSNGRSAGAGGGAGGTADITRGGHGLQIDITGERELYSGDILYYGGGGGSEESESYSTRGWGGDGGGGQVGNNSGGYPGDRDTGGGGGGAGKEASWSIGGYGGSGIVVIRYL